MTGEPAGAATLEQLSADFARHDQAALRDRLRIDGFLFFRGLIPAVDVWRVRSAVLCTLAGVGWLEPGSDPDAARPGPSAHHDRGRLDGRAVSDPGWAEGYRAIQSLESLHRLAHHDALLAVLGTVLGEPPVVHPRKIVRVTFPAAGLPTPPHQDAAFNKTTDVLTTWIPLGDCSRRLGGLRLLRGSTRRGELPVRPGDGIGGEQVDVSADDPNWVSCDYHAGDVVVFHGYSVHGAPPNLSDRLRLSADFRYQSTQEPVKLAALLPHGFGAGLLPAWSELTAGWRSTRWVEVPQRIRVATVSSAFRVPSALLGTDTALPGGEQRAEDGLPS
jgi:hypothetical protein